MTLLVLFYILNFSYFMNIYFVKLPFKYAHIWNYGWKEAVSYVNTKGSSFDNIIISDVNGMPYIYFLFYNKYDPQKFQKESLREYSSDRFGFEHVEGFDKYLFPYEFDWENVKENSLKNSLYILPVENFPKNEKSDEDIKYPNGRVLFKILSDEQI